MDSLLVWGANSYGQLGAGNCVDLERPKIIKLPSDIQIVLKNSNVNRKLKLFGGAGHSFILCENENNGDCELYCAGWNDKGQLGLGENHKNNNSLIFQKVLLLPQKRITQISCGWNHTLALTDDGSVYGTGSDYFGQLNNGKVNLCQFTFLGFKAKNIFAGLNYSFFITNDDRLLFCGLDKGNKLELPVKGSLTELTPFTDDNCKIIQIIGGHSHFLALDERRRVYSIGSNKYGQLGRTTSTADSKEWKIVEIPEEIDYIACGWNHCLALNKSSQNLWIWGRNDKGQLGIGNFDCITQPQLLTGFPIENVFAGAECTYIEDKEFLYGTGWNEHGNLGIGTTADSFEFVKICKRPNEFCTGYSHCLMIP